MKNIKHIIFKITALLIAVSITSCERDLSEDAVFATFPKNGDVFIDTFSAGLDYFPFVDAGADPFAFSVVTDEKFSGTSSMRFDVPTFGNGFVGANFGTSSKRDLSGFDALTFYARATQVATLNSVGFGINGETNSKFIVEANNLEVSTGWRKYIIPIPDPSKLIDASGLFWLAEGASFVGDEGGYTFWVDEIKFEKLGTIGQPQPAIFNGVDQLQQSFAGSSLPITGLSQTFDLGNNESVTTTAAPSYFDFFSSSNEVASVNELGEISITDEGETTITAALGGVMANGSLSLEVLDTFVGADIPPARDPQDVISIFSDAYSNVNNLNFAVFNDANVQIQVQNFNNDQIISYENLGFVGLGWDGTSNVSGMTHLHLDVQVTSSTNTSLIVELIDFGANNSDGGGDDTGGGSDVSSQLVEGSWVGIDIPINAFTLGTGGGFLGSPNLNNVSRVVLVSNGGSLLVDNIYFYNE